MPLKNRYAIPGQVGIDRLAGASGGVSLLGTPLVVVDAGTAITVDVVSRRGEFLGGAILPGIALGAHALATRTAKLPHVDLVTPVHAIGRTTDENIRSGLYFGTAGAVDAVVRRCWKELGYPHESACDRWRGGLYPRALDRRQARRAGADAARPCGNP